jgi:hypothetical protein
MKPAARRAIGSAILLAYLAIYVAVAVTIGGFLANAPAWALLIYYALAGTAWGLPLYPLFVWMRGADAAQETRATESERRGRE